MTPDPTRDALECRLCGRPASERDDFALNDGRCDRCLAPTRDALPDAVELALAELLADVRDQSIHPHSPGKTLCLRDDLEAAILAALADAERRGAERMRERSRAVRRA